MYNIDLTPRRDPKTLASPDRASSYRRAVLELHPEADLVVARPLPPRREVEAGIRGSLEAAVAHAAVLGGNDLRVQDVEDGSNDAGADRTDREVLLELRVPLVEVRQPAASTGLLEDDAVPRVGSVRGGHVVRDAAVPVDVGPEGELERQLREAGHRHAVPRVVGEIAEAVDEVVRVDVEVARLVLRVLDRAL